MSFPLGDKHCLFADTEFEMLIIHPGIHGTYDWNGYRALRGIDLHHSWCAGNGNQTQIFKAEGGRTMLESTFFSQDIELGKPIGN